MPGGRSAGARASRGHGRTRAPQEEAPAGTPRGDCSNEQCCLTGCSIRLSVHRPLRHMPYLAGIPASVD